ncbi:amidase [Paraburkholderia sp. MMS20-SJTR3]|uniref:Amidase n=1 Tax=Paraburkholderia sejongensis TaxID=2886946 RepID=A0ABS8K089_9BURK|nr:amidase [Paraburkholderia sp. MMS20-SJTR3]MCC8395586.1 amidase [Paraburkholderia sp. MMS20-SJTR3]
MSNLAENVARLETGQPAQAWRYASAARAAAALRCHEVSSQELVAACEAAWREANPRVNAVVLNDFERAHAIARQRDEELAAGRPRGPLHGVPFTIKESFDVAGWPTTVGDPAFRDNIAARDAAVVQRLSDAGAVLLGKTNVPLWLRDWQSYNDIYGTTRNPHDLARTPGGSSGGSAAAVSTGMAFFDVGSDIGSSIRNPAHYCGIYSHKSTHGLVSLDGHGLPGGVTCPDINVAGPLARSANDLALVLEAIMGPPPDAACAVRFELPRCAAKNLDQIRFGILSNHPVAPVDAEVERCIVELGRALERRGAQVLWDARPQLDAVELLRTYTLLLRASTCGYLGDEAFASALAAADAADPADTSYASLQYTGAAMRHRDWLKLQPLREKYAAAWRALFTRVDVLLCPVAATAAFTLNEEGAPWQRTLDVNGEQQPLTTQLFWAGHSGLCGLPSTVAPAGRTASGLPVGVQIVAPLYHDLRSIQVASLLEAEGYAAYAPPAAL